MSTITAPRTKQRVVMSTVSNGPIRAAIEAQGAALSLFSRADQNTILRTALQAIGNLWIKVFLPLRFTDYARNQLGYVVSSGWESKKVKLAGKGLIASPQPTPNVYIGQMMEVATKQSRAEATATASRAITVIKIPFGHPVLPATTIAFKTVPGHEIKRMAFELGKILPQLVSSGVATYNDKGDQMQLRGAASPMRSVGTTQRQV